jgi:hypothetical protein
MGEMIGHAKARGSKPGRKARDKPYRTMVGLKTATKRRLSDNRFPGQSHDGFICQLLDLWQKRHGDGSRKGAIQGRSSREIHNSVLDVADKLSQEWM